eukprot:Awhi_evm1s7672
MTQQSFLQQLQSADVSDIENIGTFYQVPIDKDLQELVDEFSEAAVIINVEDFSIHCHNEKFKQKILTPLTTTTTTPTASPSAVATSRDGPSFLTTFFSSKAMSKSEAHLKSSSKINKSKKETGEKNESIRFLSRTSKMESDFRYAELSLFPFSPSQSVNGHEIFFLIQIRDVSLLYDLYNNAYPISLAAPTTTTAFTSTPIIPSNSNSDMLSSTAGNVNLEYLNEKPSVEQNVMALHDL